MRDEPPRVLRTFVGFPIAEEVRQRLAHEAERLAAGIRGLRPIRPENLHLTLHFIGATLEDDVPAVVSAVTRACEGRGPVAVRYEGLGAFPSPSRPRVLWAGVVETASPGALEGLAGALQASLRPLGHGGEERTYHAHVTLARAGSARVRSVERLLGEGEGRDGPAEYGAEVLSDLRLMVSEPGPRGSHYRPLASVTLA